MERNSRGKSTILAVDDNPANLVALEAVLGREYNLVLAHSGPEAIAKVVEHEGIDVILMDVQMPEMDGFEASARIKQLEGARDIPIVFITAVYREDPFIKKGYSVGAIDYFSKPFDPEILKLKVGIYASFRQKAAVLKERERQIRESEELLKAGRKLSSILEALPVGVLIADTEGRICQTNEAISRIWNSAEPLAEDAYGELLGWWDAGGKLIKGKDGPLARALRDGETSHNDVVQIECFDGAVKNILCSASPLRALDEHIVGVVVIIQDVTEPKKIEEALKQRITKLVSLGVELEHETAPT